LVCFRGVYLKIIFFAWCNIFEFSIVLLLLLAEDAYLMQMARQNSNGDTPPCFHDIGWRGENN
jgi:hypothetical protein